MLDQREAVFYTSACFSYSMAWLKRDVSITEAVVRCSALSLLKGSSSVYLGPSLVFIKNGAGPDESTEGDGAV